MSKTATLTEHLDRFVAMKQQLGYRSAVLILKYFPGIRRGTSAIVLHLIENS